MSDSPAKISVSLHGVSLEFSGSEAFVTQQVESFKSAIVASLNRVPGPAHATPSQQAPSGAPTQLPAVNTPATATAPVSTTNVAFPNALHIEGDKVQVLKSVPGTTVSKKAVAVCLVYLWAKKSVRVETVPFPELREVCKAHGCLDSANFASTINRAKEWLVVDGAPGSSLQTCKLTVPGIDRALEILKSLNEA